MILEKISTNRLIKGTYKSLIPNKDFLEKINNLHSLNNKRLLENMVKRQAEETNIKEESYFFPKNKSSSSGFGISMIALGGFMLYSGFDREMHHIFSYFSLGTGVCVRYLEYKSRK